MSLRATFSLFTTQSKGASQHTYANHRTSASQLLVVAHSCYTSQCPFVDQRHNASRFHRENHISTASHRPCKNHTSIASHQHRQNHTVDAMLRYEGEFDLPLFTALLKNPFPNPHKERHNQYANHHTATISSDSMTKVRGSRHRLCKSMASPCQDYAGAVEARILRSESWPPAVAFSG